MATTPGLYLAAAVFMCPVWYFKLSTELPVRVNGGLGANLPAYRDDHVPLVLLI